MNVWGENKKALPCFLGGDVLNVFFLYENRGPYFLLHFYADIFTGGIDFL